VPRGETMIAMRTDEPIAYDGAAARVTNVADANRLLDREYRKEWAI
jgi:hypothetical protein